MQKFLNNDGSRLSVGDFYTTTSIASPGPPTLSNQKKLTLTEKPFVEKHTTRVSDIEGAYFTSKYNKIATKPPAATLPESMAQPRTHARNVMDKQLYISDIDGAQFRANGGMERTNRHLDPLSPDYKLPSFLSPLPFVVDRPVRDNLYTLNNNNNNNNNTSLSSPSSSFSPFNSPYRGLHYGISVEDIEGAQADMTHRKREKFMAKAAAYHASAAALASSHSEPQLSSFSFQKEEFLLKKPRFQDRTSRHTNLMAPVYAVNGLLIEDDATKCKPRKSKGFVEGGTFSLQTEDIPGAVPRVPRRRRDIRNIMNTHDVQGAQADTIVHSIQTQRLTNPLNPTYQSLDYGEPLASLSSSLLPPEMVNVPTLRPRPAQAPIERPVPIRAIPSGPPPPSTTSFPATTLLSPVRTDPPPPAASPYSGSPTTSAREGGRNMQVPPLNVQLFSPIKLSARDREIAEVRALG